MKRVSLTTLTVALVLASMPAGRAVAQEKPAAASTAPEAEKAKDTAKPPDSPPEAKVKSRQPPTLLRVQLVVARFQGERKTGSAPYTFLVLAGESRARVRMGVETPISLQTSQSESKVPMASYQYKSVGTNIDCSAEDRGAGLYQLNLSVENSSVHTTEGHSPGGPPESTMAGDRPLFRSFNAALYLVLRDGQTLQTVASTDPVTGEVVRIDVSLNVVK